MWISVKDKYARYVDDTAQIIPVYSTGSYKHLYEIEKRNEVYASKDGPALTEEGPVNF